MIQVETINAIKDAAQIEEVVQDFVRLKKRGANLLGLCPFHNEKTPSFTVSPAKGIYKCFGCGEAGDSIKFIMEHERYSYVEAMRYLAAKYNVEIEEVKDDEALAQQSRYESLSLVNQFALEHFTSNLFETTEGKSVGLSYFTQRGFRENIIKKFQLGFSLKNGTALVNAAAKKGFETEYLSTLGLIGQRQERIFDFFRDRVIFPIHNHSGKVIAFAGRTLLSDKKIPKYINSPESEIYNKSNVVYGLHLAKKAIRVNDSCYLVEGYTDVISLHQAGIENVVASSGTSLTEGQIAAIRRNSSNLILLFDGDEAGVQAALRGTSLALKADMNVQVVTLPAGKDPDSFIAETGKAGFETYVEKHIQDFVFFTIGVLGKDLDRNPVRKVGTIKTVVDIIGQIPDPVKRAVYVKESASLLKVDERLLHNELNKRYRTQLKKISNQQEAASVDYLSPDEAVRTDPSISKADIEENLLKIEKKMVSLLLKYGGKKIEDGTHVAPYLIDSLENLDIAFKDELCQMILEEYVGLLKQEKEPEESHFTHHTNTQIADFSISALLTKEQPSQNWEKKHQIVVVTEEDIYQKVIQNYIDFATLRRVRLLMDENLKKLEEAESQERYQEMEKIQKVHQHLIAYQKEIAGKLNIVVFST